MPPAHALPTAPRSRRLMDACPVFRLLLCFGETDAMRCGAVAEWSKALAWKVSMGQKPIEGSNPSRSARCQLYSIDIIPKKRKALFCSIVCSHALLWLAMYRCGP